MKKLAALYARVSTMQQEQEATIDSQIAAIETLAEKQGYQLSKDLYFLDQAVSGARLDRPALNRLRDLAPESLFEAVLCLSPDRLARKYAYQQVLLDELQQAGVKVIFVNQPIIDDNPQAQLLLSIQGAFSEYERAMITERLRRGKLHRVRQGKLINHVTPYGYRYIKISEPGGGRWEINPVEAKVVQQIYQWYIDDDQETILNIVDKLNQMGDQAPPRGKAWQFSTVQSVLKQGDYTGKAYYNRTRTCHEVIGRPRKIGRGKKRHPIHVPRPKEEWIPVSVPVIVSDDIWSRAQEKLTMRQKFSPRNNSKHFYLLRSMLVCSVCGRTLVGRTAKNGRQTYYCSNQGRQRSPDVQPHSCVIAAEIVDPLVWQAITELLQNPRLIADAWQSSLEPHSNSQNEANRLQGRLKTLDRQWDRLLDLYQDEEIEKDELSLRKQRLDQERLTIQQRLKQLNSQISHQQTKEQMIQDFFEFCQQIQSGLSNPTPELQQEVIRLLIDHVVVGKNEIVIKHIVPTDDDCRLLPGHR